MTIVPVVIIIYCVRAFYTSISDLASTPRGSVLSPSLLSVSLGLYKKLKFVKIFSLDITMVAHSEEGDGAD